MNAAARAAAAKLTEKLFPGRLASDVLSPVRCVCSSLMPPCNLLNQHAIHMRPPFRLSCTLSAPKPEQSVHARPSLALGLQGIPTTPAYCCRRSWRPRGSAPSSTAATRRRTSGSWRRPTSGCRRQWSRPSTTRCAAAGGRCRASSTPSPCPIPQRQARHTAFALFAAATRCRLHLRGAAVRAVHSIQKAHSTKCRHQLINVWLFRAQTRLSHDVHGMTLEGCPLTGLRSGAGGGRSGDSKPESDSSEGGPAANDGPWEHISEDGSPGAGQQQRAPQAPAAPQPDSSEGGPAAKDSPWDSISEDGSPGAGMQPLARGSPKPQADSSEGGPAANDGPWDSISEDGSPGAGQQQPTAPSGGASHSSPDPWTPISVDGSPGAELPADAASPPEQVTGLHVKLASTTASRRTAAGSYAVCSRFVLARGASA